MDENEYLAERFETYRSHLRAVAYRMLGSLSEADDACSLRVFVRSQKVQRYINLVA